VCTVRWYGLLFVMVWGGWWTCGAGGLLLLLLAMSFPQREHEAGGLGSHSTELCGYVMCIECRLICRTST
jgi:hypothetical protein